MASVRVLPCYVRQEFDVYLKCGRLEHGFLRVQCDTWHAEHMIVFNCKRRVFCPSFGARRMAVSAALLVDEVLPKQAMRQVREHKMEYCAHCGKWISDEEHPG